MFKNLILIINLIFSNSIIDVCESHKILSNSNNKAVLIGPDISYLYWNYTDTDITFELHVKNDGWVMFGLSPEKDIMEESDVVVTWLKTDGTYHFTDRHIKNNRVNIDRKQDWLPINIYKHQDIFIAKFTRKLKICDENKQDIDVVSGTPDLLIAYGPGQFNDNLDNNIYVKNFRPTALIETLNQVIDYTTPDIEIANFTVNYTILPGHHTVYFCQVFKLPAKWLKSKTHVVKFEIILTPGNEKYLHHLILTECSKRYEKEYLKTKGDPKPGLCSSLHPSQPSSEYDLIQDLCYKISFVWQVGGNLAVEFPPDKGYPVGGPDEEFKYFMIEMHYNNPDNDLNVQDFSGFRFYATQKLRPIEFGLLTFGATFDWKSIMIPPGIENYQTDFFMRKECINQLLNSKEIQNGEIRMFASLFHTHNIGKRASAKIIRDSKEVSTFYKNNFYDGLSQEYQYFKKPIVLKKDDQVKLSCSFNSKSKTEYTKGGLSASEEMCQMWVMYYPRNPSFVRCKEMISSDSWLSFLKELDRAGDIKLTTENITDEIPKDLLKARLTPLLKRKIQDFHQVSLRTQQVFDIDKNISTTTKNSPVKSLPPAEENCENTNSIFQNFWNFINSFFKKN